MQLPDRETDIDGVRAMLQSFALKISRRLYVMGHGQIVFEGSPQDLASNHGVRQEWLEV